jgi:hypothetical protein
MTDLAEALRALPAPWECPVYSHRQLPRPTRSAGDLTFCAYPGCRLYSGGPQRIQQRRDPGWRKPGGAISVTRSTRWGNQWKVLTKPQWGYPALTVVQIRRRYPGPDGHAFGGFSDETAAAQFAVELFHRDLLAAFSREQATVKYYLGDLVGHDLMCFCKPQAPCHAGVLLMLAAEYAERSTRR